MAEKSVEELKAIVEQQKAAIDSQNKSITEQQKANSELASQLKAKDQTIKELETKVGTLTKANEGLTADVSKSGEVVAELKKKIEDQAAEAALDVIGGTTVHKYGKKRYRLLYSVLHNGQEITDQVLKGNEELLGELVDGGSGAIAEVL